MPPVPPPFLTLPLYPNPPFFLLCLCLPLSLSPTPSFSLSVSPSLRPCPCCVFIRFFLHRRGGGPSCLRPNVSEGSWATATPTRHPPTGPPTATLTSYLMTGDILTDAPTTAPVTGMRVHLGVLPCPILGKSEQSIEHLAGRCVPVYRQYCKICLLVALVHKVICAHAQLIGVTEPGCLFTACLQQCRANMAAVPFQCHFPRNDPTSVFNKKK